MLLRVVLNRLVVAYKRVVNHRLHDGAIHKLLEAEMDAIVDAESTVLHVLILVVEVPVIFGSA